MTDAEDGMNGPRAQHSDRNADAYMISHDGGTRMNAGALTGVGTGVGAGMTGHEVATLAGAGVGMASCAIALSSTASTASVVAGSGAMMTIAVVGLLAWRRIRAARAESWLARHAIARGVADGTTPDLSKDLRAMMSAIDEGNGNEIGRLTTKLSIRLERATGRRFSDQGDVVELTCLGNPAATAGKLRDHFAWLLSQIERSERSAAHLADDDEIRRRLSIMVWLWRQTLAAYGLDGSAIAFRNAPVMPMPGSRPTPGPGVTGVEQMERMLREPEALRRVLAKAQGFGAASSKHFDQLDVINTRNLIENEIPRLASSFNEAIGAAVEDDREGVEHLAMQSLGMIEAAIDETMRRHAANALRDLQVHHLFLQTRASNGPIETE